MAGDPIRVLLVEDSEADAELAQRELRRAGVSFAARRVETEFAFRGALAAELPDVILADYRMPVFDGLTALHIAREIAPLVPFIFVSGSLGEERAVEALREGATDYILKDRPSRLPAAVARAIRDRDEKLARARAEAAVVESERRFHYAALATREVIWDLDLASNSLYVNDSMRTQWGHPNANIDPEWWLSRIHPDERAEVLQSFQSWLSSAEERWTTSYRFRRGDGSYGDAVQHALVLRDEKGAPQRVFGAMQDVTESRRLKDQVDRADRVDSLGRLAATIAHEFNNVLMAIQPVAELISRSDDERTARLGTKIVQGVDRGKRVTGEILRMTRVPDPIPETFDFSALTDDLRGDLQAVTGPDVEVVVEIASDPIMVCCDRAQLQQVLANLAANARDAMPHGGTLTLSVTARDEEVLISVADTGSGMPVDILDRIFEPLFSTKRTGTGLGLAVCQRLLRQNGGNITVESALGKGTVFHITLPPPREQVAGGVLHDVSSGPVQQRRILLAEDNPNVAEGIRMLLETEGFEIHVVETGTEALDAIEEWSPDILILDMSLPDMTGTEVFAEVVRRRPDLPVILASGHAEVSGMTELLRRPGTAFLRKPFSFQALQSVMQAVSRLPNRRFQTGEDHRVAATG